MFSVWVLLLTVLLDTSLFNSTLLVHHSLSGELSPDGSVQSFFNSKLMLTLLQVQRLVTAHLRDHFSEPIDTAPPRQTAPIAARYDDDEEIAMKRMDDRVL